MSDLTAAPAESTEDADFDGLSHYVCCASGYRLTFCGMPMTDGEYVPRDAPDDDDCVVCLDLSDGGYVCPFLGSACPEDCDPDPPGR